MPLLPTLTHRASRQVRITGYGPRITSPPGLTLDASNNASQFALWQELADR